MFQSSEKFAISPSCSLLLLLLVLWIQLRNFGRAFYFTTTLNTAIFPPAKFFSEKWGFADCMDQSEHTVLYEDWPTHRLIDLLVLISAILQRRQQEAGGEPTVESPVSDSSTGGGRSRGAREFVPHNCGYCCQFCNQSCGRPKPFHRYHRCRRHAHL